MDLTSWSVACELAYWKAWQRSICLNAHKQCIVEIYHGDEGYYWCNVVLTQIVLLFRISGRSEARLSKYKSCFKPPLFFIVAALTLMKFAEFRTIFWFSIRRNGIDFGTNKQFCLVDDTYLHILYCILYSHVLIGITIFDDIEWWNNYFCTKFLVYWDLQHGSKFQIAACSS